MGPWFAWRLEVFAAFCGHVRPFHLRHGREAISHRQDPELYGVSEKVHRQSDGNFSQITKLTTRARFRNDYMEDGGQLMCGRLAI